MFRNAGIIYSTGFFITSNCEVLRKVCHLAAEEDKLMAFNVAAVFVTQFYTEDVKYCLKHSDFVFCNEDECDALADML